MAVTAVIRVSPGAVTIQKAEVSQGEVQVKDETRRK